MLAKHKVRPKGVSNVQIGCEQSVNFFLKTSLCDLHSGAEAHALCFCLGINGSFILVGKRNGSQPWCLQVQYA